MNHWVQQWESQNPVNPFPALWPWPLSSFLCSAFFLSLWGYKGCIPQCSLPCGQLPPVLPLLTIICQEFPLSWPYGLVANIFEFVPKLCNVLYRHRGIVFAPTELMALKETGRWLAGERETICGPPALSNFSQFSLCLALPTFHTNLVTPSLLLVQIDLHQNESRGKSQKGLFTLKQINPTALCLLHEWFLYP